MLHEHNVPANKQAAQEGAAENRQEVADVHAHDCNHEQVADAGQQRVEEGTEGVDGQTPGADVGVALLEDHHVLLDSILGQDHALGARVLRDLLGEDGLAGHDDVAALELGVQPARLGAGLESK